MTLLMANSKHRKLHLLALVALALLLSMATQFVNYVISECDSCDEIVCLDWSCCLCANASPCDLTVSTCPQPSLILVGIISPVHDQGRTPETAFELDRPPRPVSA